MPMQCTDFSHYGCWIKHIFAYLLVRSVEEEEEKEQTGLNHCYTMHYGQKAMVGGPVCLRPQLHFSNPSRQCIYF